MQNPAAGAGTKWTSWEGYNYILKGLVDELISLGARPQLKLITLQLWAKYLCKLEAAFTSKTRPLLPKFGLRQDSIDYTLIEDYIKKRKSKEILEAKQLSSDSHDVSCNVEHELDKKELASSQDIPREIDSRIEVMNITKESDRYKTTTQTAVDHQIKFNKESRAAVKKMVGTTDFTAECMTSIKENHIGALRQLSCFDPMCLTRTMVLGILCLALFFSKDSIQMSDVMRWINEDHVSYLNLARLFPEEIKLSGSKYRSLRVVNSVRYKSVQRCTFHIANLMGVEVFPAPDLAALVRRFVIELQLPSMLSDHVQRLMVQCRINLCKRMMSYEAVVMAFIIVVLKTLFGLDGHTEHSISEFAKEINGLLDDDANESDVGARLFVWDDWVRYIECRKSVIITKHFPSKFRIEKDLTTAAGPFVHHFNKEQIKNHHVNEKCLFKSKCESRTKRNRWIAREIAVAQLPTWKKITKSLEFPPSLTPQVSYLKQIIYMTKSGTIANTDILTYDHTTTSLEFLIQPNKIIEFARSQGVDVDIKKSPVYRSREYISKGKYTTLRIPLTTPVVVVNIKDEDDSQPKPQASQWPPKRTKKRKITFDSNSNNNESFKKKKRQERESIPTDCLNNVYSNSTHVNSKEGKHFSKCEQYNAETRATSSTRRNTLTLHIPFSAYWVYEINRRQPEESFVNMIEPDFSHSFRWLLNECSRILEMKTLDLYRVLRQVETLCSSDVDPTILQLTYRLRDKRWKNENLA